MKWLMSTSLLFGSLVVCLGQMAATYTLESFVGESEVIVEGVIQSKESFYALDGMIYTKYEMEVYYDYLGNGTSEVAFISIGGQMEDEALHVCPSLHFDLGEYGVLGLRKVDIRGDNGIYLQPVSAIHSWIDIDQYGRVSDHAAQQYTVSGLRQRLEDLTGHPVRELDKSRPELLESAVTITSITPLSTQAGRGQEITVNGSGFESTQGSGHVFFRNVDGASTSLTVAGITYTKWTDTQIKVEVPYRAGNGAIKVKNKSGTESSPSGQTLTVTYNVTNTGSGSEIRCIDDNLDGRGGYDFHYSTNTANGGVDFTSIPAAVAAVERAGTTWNNGTKFTIFTEQACGTTSIQEPAYDGVNVITFDNSLYDLDFRAGSSVLGQMHTYYAKCTGVEWELVDLDMIVRRDGDPNGTRGKVMWEYGPGSPSSGEADFESVVLHEFGHGHLMGHVRQSGAVMYPSIVLGTTNRTLSSSETTGGTYIQNGSTSYSPPINPGCPSPWNTARQYLDFDPNNICSLVLPLDLVSFEAEKLDDQAAIVLKWTTVNEFNHDRILLEHSVDMGRSWQAISVFHATESRPGYPADYRFVHEDLVDGVHLYRLKIVDVQERFEYSDVRSEELVTKETSFSVKGSGRVLDLQFRSSHAEMLELEIYSMSGVPVLTKAWSVSAGSNIKTVDASRWLSGVYLIRLGTGHGDNEYLVKHYVN